MSNTKIIQDSQTISIPSFEEAFGAGEITSAASGRRRARRQERKADKRAQRTANRASKQASRQAARTQRKATRVGGRDDRKRLRRDARDERRADHAATRQQRRMDRALAAQDIRDMRRQRRIARQDMGGSGNNAINDNSGDYNVPNGQVYGGSQDNGYSGGGSYQSQAGSYDNGGGSYDNGGGSYQSQAGSYDNGGGSYDNGGGLGYYDNGAGSYQSDASYEQNNTYQDIDSSNDQDGDFGGNGDAGYYDDNSYGYYSYGADGFKKWIETPKKKANFEGDFTQLKEGQEGYDTMSDDELSEREINPTDTELLDDIAKRILWNDVRIFNLNKQLTQEKRKDEDSPKMDSLVQQIILSQDRIDKLTEQVSKFVGGDIKKSQKWEMAKSNAYNKAKKAVAGRQAERHRKAGEQIRVSGAKVVKTKIGKGLDYKSKLGRIVVNEDQSNANGSGIIGMDQAGEYDAERNRVIQLKSNALGLGPATSNKPNATSLIGPAIVLGIVGVGLYLALKNAK